MIFVSSVDAQSEVSMQGRFSGAPRTINRFAISEHYFRNRVEKSTNMDVLNATAAEKIISIGQNNKTDLYAVSWLDEKEKRIKFLLINKNDETSMIKLTIDCDGKKSVVERISAIKNNFWYGSYVETCTDLNHEYFHISLALKDIFYIEKMHTRCDLLIFGMLDGIISSDNALGIALGIIMELANMEVSNSNYGMNIRIDCIT